MPLHARTAAAFDYGFADDGASRVLALAPGIDPTLLGDGSLRVDVPDPGETLAAALRRIAPAALLIDAALIDGGVADALEASAARGLPVVVLVDLETSDRAGLLLGMADVRFAPPLAPLPALRAVLTETAAASVSDGTLWHDALPAASGASPPLAQVRAVIRARRLRARFLPADWFADPAWDMLLDLAAAELAGVRQSVSALCVAADVPPTTALRWIKRLCDDGHLVRAGDPLDRRRMFIGMAPATSAAVHACLAAMIGQLAL